VEIGDLTVRRLSVGELFVTDSLNAPAEPPR
jgi:hypothetical protein